jgi:hypothetical protein
MNEGHKCSNNIWLSRPNPNLDKSYFGSERSRAALSVLVGEAPKGSTGPIVAPPLQLLVSLPKILKFFKKIVKDSLGTY